MEEFLPVFVLSVIGLTVVTIIRVVSEARTRNRLIEKGMIDENIRHLYSNQAKLQTLSNLKWGMVLVGIGLAALISQLFPQTISDEMALGLAFLFAGAGFLIYVPIAQNQLKKTSEDQSRSQGNQ